MTMTSEFMIALYGSFAQAESESISKNVSWGIEKAFREGKVKYNLGPPPSIKVTHFTFHSHLSILPTNL